VKLNCGLCQALALQVRCPMSLRCGAPCPPSRLTRPLDRQAPARLLRTNLIAPSRFKAGRMPPPPSSSSSRFRNWFLRGPSKTNPPARSPLNPHRHVLRRIPRHTVYIEPRFCYWFRPTVCVCSCAGAMLHEPEGGGSGEWVPTVCLAGQVAAWPRLPWTSGGSACCARMRRSCFFQMRSFAHRWMSCCREARVQSLS
jgi:hypothetical protein